MKKDEFILFSLYILKVMSIQIFAHIHIIQFLLTINYIVYIKYKHKIIKLVYSLKKISFCIHLNGRS